MPSYGAVNLFGAAVTMSTADKVRETQVNSYFGIDGLETLDGGFRGRFTEVSGILYGNSAIALASAESLVRSYHDGVARTLVDNLGTAWPNVKLETFQPQGRIKQSPYGYFYRPYQARFFHLV